MFINEVGYRPNTKGSNQNNIDINKEQPVLKVSSDGRLINVRYYPTSDIVRDGTSLFTFFGC